MRNHTIFVVMSLLCLAAPAVHSQGLHIKATISLTRVDVREGEFFTVSTTLRNTGKETQATWLTACNDGDLWVPDNRSISMAPSACDKPGFDGLRLKPGQVYHADLRVSARLEPGAEDSQSITFKLGFKSEFQNASDPPTQKPVATTLWSNAVTIKVTRAIASSRDANRAPKPITAPGPPAAPPGR